VSRNGYKALLLEWAVFSFCWVQFSMQWTDEQSEKVIPAHQLPSGA